jgi:acyl-CoA reductase-like NAD-dependent aldehyde dehydrogenase
MTVTTQQRYSVPHPNQVFIGGTWVTPATSQTVAVVSPYTGETLVELAGTSQADADRAVAAAKEAFERGPWRTMSVEERLVPIRKFRDELERRIDDFDQAWCDEIGIPITIARSFDALTFTIADDGINLAATTPLVEQRDTPAGTVSLRHEPIGPVLAVLTYNGPIIEIGMAVLPGLAVGNSIIVKLPPESRMIGHIVADCAAAAGFPDGVFSLLTADVEVSKHLVAHEDIAAVHFTGGTEIGADVAAACARRIAPVTLELGGKAAAILTEDTDLEAILPTLVGGMTTLQGQMCVATTRVLVPRSRQDELVQLLVAAFGQTVIGDPRDEGTTYGPMPSERIRSRAEGYVARAVEEGATVAFGGQRPAGIDQGYFFEPTLLTNVTPDMEVAQNEIFGPVYAVIPYDGIDEAISITNGTKYGLASSIFTDDTELAAYVASRVEVGAFAINGGFPCLTSPYGGYKQSGYGRSSGVEGLLNLTRIKSVVDYSA